MQKTIEEIRDAFILAAIPVDAVPMAAYMKHIAPFFGIKASPRRLIQRGIFAAYQYLPDVEWDVLLKALYKQPERELHYLAIDWLYHRRKTFTPQTITLIEWMITTRSWWDTVDHLATRCLGYWASRFPQEARSVIQQFVLSDDLWLARSAIIHQLHFGEATDTTLLKSCIMPHTGSKKFFLQKAIGWALRHYARTDPDWVREFVATQPLAALSRREAMKYL